MGWKWDEAQDLGVLDKVGKNETRVRLLEDTEGNLGIDVRQFVVDGGGYIGPTKKGAVISDLPAFKAMLDKAMKGAPKKPVARKRSA